MQLEGRVVLLTGASRGLGRAIALELAGRGAKVVCAARDERGLGETVGEIAYQGGKARHVVCDVRDRASIESTVAIALDTFGPLDVVIANAGVSGVTPLVGGDAQAMDDIVTTNLLGTLHTFRAAAPHVRDGGRLIATSSVLGKFGVAGYGAYCASKAGIQGLVRALAHELAPRKITVNALCPGWVETDMAITGVRGMAETMGVSEAEAKRVASAQFPLGRFLEPDEVARWVAFLAGPDGGIVTGQSFSVCGGSTAFGG